ncbi:hypothetical protein FH972_019847 [Carpinus fangiana]|uniref:Uncharacterized protein n=1 Tax=Carpinus fangiana TaxID=176857 RepID=A0A5N6RTM5_9ROSI|nr:hypothetical protein FH972_019847 [Carpinus fangiana]
METSSPLPEQQGQVLMSNPEAVPSSSASHSSGSIGPFFAVISVLTLLAILSCVLGRMCTRGGGSGAVTPVECVRDRGFFGWVRRKFRRCMVGAAEGGAKMMAFRKEIGKQVEDDGGELQHPPQP